MKIFFTILTTLCLCSCANLSIPEAVKKEINKDLKNYINCRDYKAYAVAVDADGFWASGYGYGYPNQELANKRALLECETQKFSDGLKAKCTIVHDGSMSDNGI